MVTYNKRILKLVQFDRSDVPRLIELSASVGWDYVEKEIGTFCHQVKYLDIKMPRGKLCLVPQSSLMILF